MASTWREWAQLVVCVVLVTLKGADCQPTTGSCNRTTVGSKFYLGFMEVTSLQQLGIRIFASRGVAGSAPITVNVTAGGRTIPGTVTTDQPLLVDLSPASETGSNIIMMGSALQGGKGVLVEASADVSVVAITEDAASCTALHVLPISVLSRSYIATTYAPNPNAPSGSFIAEFAVVSAADGNQIQITFPATMQGTVTYNSAQTLRAGDTLNVALNNLDAVQIQSTSDLTGTLITSSGNVAVFSGNAKASLGEAMGPAAEQLIPISSQPVSSVYVFYGYSGTTGYQVKFVTTQPNTEVTVRAPSGIINQSSFTAVGSTYMSSFASNLATVVESNKPLQAMQLGLSPPTMSIVPPTLSFLSTYRFNIPTGTNIPDYSRTVMLIANSADINSFLINDVIASPVWQSINIAGFSFQVASVTVSGGLNTISNGNTGAKFGALVYCSSASRNCAFSYPADMCLDWVQAASDQQTGSTAVIATNKPTPQRTSSESSLQSTLPSTLSSSLSSSSSSATSQSTTALPQSSSSVSSSSVSSSSVSSAASSSSSSVGSTTSGQTLRPTPSVQQGSSESSASTGSTQLVSSTQSETSTPQRRPQTPVASELSTLSSMTSVLSGSNSAQSVSDTSTNTPTFTISSTNTPTFTISSTNTPTFTDVFTTPTFSMVSSSSLPSSSSLLSTGLSASLTGAFSTIGSSGGFSVITSSFGMISDTSPTKQPTDFSSLSSGIISSPSKVPTDFSSMSSRIPTGDFTTVTGSTVSKLLTDFSTITTPLLTAPTGFSTVVSTSSTVTGSTTTGSTTTGSTTTAMTPAPVGNNNYVIPVNAATGPGQSVVVHMTNPSSSPVTATLSFLGSDKSIPIDPNGVRDEFIPRPNNFPSGLPTETAKLTSSSPILVSVTNVGSCAQYLNIPTAGLGRNYQVVTWDASPTDMGNSWFTITTVDETLVTVILPDGTCDVKSSFIDLACGDTFSVVIPAASSMTFTSINDVSGTMIQAQNPVLVIAGNEKVTIGQSSVVDTAASEMFPMEAWGKEFIVPAVPDNNSTGYTIKMMSGTVAASVTVKSASQTTTKDIPAGKPLIMEFTDNSVLSITSNNPIQVVQFIKGGQPPKDTGCPSSMYISATSLYTRTYYAEVWQSKTVYINYVTVVIDSSALTSSGGLMMDGKAVDSSNWVDVPGTTFKTKQIKLVNARTLFYHATTKFGLFRYSYVLATDVDTPCALAYVAGADYSYAPMTATTPSTTTAQSVTSATTGSTTTAAPVMTQITDCSCVTLTSKVQPAASGQYFRQSSPYNGLPVYKRDDCDVYIYNYADLSIGYWLVGPQLGAKTAYVYNWHIYQPVDQIQPNTWRAYDSTSSKFVEDSAFSIVCSCKVTEDCIAGEFLRSNGNSLINGVFTYSGQLYNGRPVYEQDSGELVLYYANSNNCSYWALADDIGSPNALIYAIDSNADNPGDVMTWQYPASSADNGKIQFTC